MIDDIRDRYGSLTERQRRIMALYAGGLTVRDCAGVFGVVPAVIYVELQKIRLEFGVNTNAGAIVLALSAGAMDMPRGGEESDGCRGITN